MGDSSIKSCFTNYIIKQFPKLAGISGVRTEELINGAAGDIAARRVPVKASVNPNDEEVKFYIDLQDIGKLM